MPVRKGSEVATEAPTYVSKADHRDGTRAKSQWTITFSAEKDCFVASWTRGWLITNRGWGLHLVDGVPASVGTSARSSGRAVPADLKVATFRGDSNIWHGYPADYCIHAQDRPPITVLQEWATLGLIRKHELRRIRGSQPCSLSD